jgi:hypothetical protein
MAIYSLMPAAGGIYSTANDLGRLLAAAMGLHSSPLSSAIKLTLDTRRPTGGSEQQALGWSVIGKGDDEIIYRDGGTYGFASSIAFDPKQRIGVVVLSNQNGSINDIARHLLRPEVPLKTATKTSHTEITIDPSLLDRYLGRYEIKDEGTFTVAREDNFLTLESPADWGLPKLRIRPETDRDFFAAELPLRITFQIDAGNHVVLVRPMKHAIILPVLATALLLIACSRASMTEPRARHVAEDAFARTCRSFRLGASDYEGPIATEVGGAAFAFEWRHRQKADHGVLVSITSDGRDETAFLEKGP